MLKKFVLAVAVLAGSFTSCSQLQADHFVHGHFTYYGAYVRPHFQSHADGNFYNNYSTRGELNPYTGQFGTHHWPSYSYPAYRYSSPYRSVYAPAF